MPCADSLMGRFCPRAEVAADRLLSHRRCARSWCRGSAASLNVRIGLPQRAPRSSRGGGENSRGALTDWFQQLKKRGKRAFYFFPSQFHFCLKSYDRHAKLQPSDCDATCLTATPAESEKKKKDKETAYLQTAITNPDPPRCRTAGHVLCFSALRSSARWKRSRQAADTMPPDHPSGRRTARRWWHRCTPVLHPPLFPLPSFFMPTWHSLRPRRITYTPKPRISTAS